MFPKIVAAMGGSQIKIVEFNTIFAAQWSTLNNGGYFSSSQLREHIYYTLVFMLVGALSWILLTLIYTTNTIQQCFINQRILHYFKFIVLVIVLAVTQS